MTDSDDSDKPGDGRDYIAALVEERIAKLSDTEFDLLCARTRPPKLDDQIKAAHDRGDVMTAIALKATTTGCVTGRPNPRKAQIHDNRQNQASCPTRRRREGHH